MSETTSKHTPGPWHAGGKGNQIVYAEDGFAVANATVFHRRHEGPQAANARLIAAAPELLEACRLSLHNAESIIYQQPAKMEDSTEIKSLRKWREVLDAAIAKAEDR